MDRTRAPNEASDAVRLGIAVSRLRSRIRIESGLRSTGIPISQLAVLARIINEGPTTASALAAGEHVTQQAIAQSLATLKERGLVEKQADPSDGRKSLVSATASGRELMETITVSREEWLTRAVEAAVKPEERPLLAEAIELLERIADVELHRGGEIR
ncbi:MAG TPA: MarR family transcriptional regulator [Streptosporangiaceae bacterium]|nr:MarR family transcriptional regulator [Streptosporangiaceae bacterium]